MGRRIRVAYADPPYLGCGRAFYGKIHPDAAKFDRIGTHEELIRQLVNEFPDGWAMSLHTPSLREILSRSPPGIRVGAWVKPFCSFKPGVNPAFAWEPVLFMGGRKRLRGEPTVRDWVACSIALRRGLAGAKPAGFCEWVFALLNLRRGDTLVDLFPGSGAVAAAWHEFCQKQRSARTGLRPA